MEFLSPETYARLKEIEPEERRAMALTAMEMLDKLSIDELHAELQTFREEFAEELNGITEGQARFSPGEGNWSINELCRHVSNSLRLTAGLSQGLAAGQTLPPNTEIKIGMMDDDADITELTTQMNAAFDIMADATENLRNDVDLETTEAHPWFGPKNCRQWVAFNLLHMFVHINQLRRIKSAPGFPTS